ncbi:hypothetical protein A2U01_0054508, partial [Trifolium medium]|nr:hypothetical protein [Trifolium medium]
GIKETEEKGVNGSKKLDISSSKSCIFGRTEQLAEREVLSPSEIGKENSGSCMHEFLLIE